MVLGGRDLKQAVMTRIRTGTGGTGPSKQGTGPEPFLAGLGWLLVCPEI